MSQLYTDLAPLPPGPVRSTPGSGIEPSGETTRAADADALPCLPARCTSLPHEHTRVQRAAARARAACNIILVYILAAPAGSP